MPLPAELRPILWVLLPQCPCILLVGHARAGSVFLSPTSGPGGAFAEQPQAGLRVPLPFRKHYSQATHPHFPAARPSGEHFPVFLTIGSDSKALICIECKMSSLTGN